MAETEYTIQSLEAALDVVESFLSQNGTWLGVTKISKRSGHNTNRVFRVLNTLWSRGYIEKDMQSQKYRLGSGFYVLGETFRKSMDLRQAAIPYLEELAEVSGDTAYLVVVSRDMALCLDARVGDHYVQAAARAGEMLPFYIGSTPKILLAFMPQARRAELIDGMKFDHPQSTISDRGELEEVLRRIQSQDYWVEDDYVIGAYSIGAPVRNLHGEVVAAISLLIPKVRDCEQRLGRMTELVVDTAKRFSYSLGYREGLPITNES